MCPFGIHSLDRCSKQVDNSLEVAPLYRASPFEAYSATSEPEEVAQSTPGAYLKKEEASWLPSTVRKSPRYRSTLPHLPIYQGCRLRLLRNLEWSNSACFIWLGHRHSRLPLIRVEEVRRFGDSDDQQLEGDTGFVDLEANLAEPASQDKDTDLEWPTLVVVDSDYSGTNRSSDCLYEQMNLRMG